jgi:hypothetical protein
VLTRVVDHLEAEIIIRPLSFPKTSSGQIRAIALGFCRFTRQSFGYVTNDTFAERLERAVAASDRAKLIEGRVNVMIDHQIDEEMIS